MNIIYSNIKSLPIIEYLAFKGVKPYSRISDEVYYLSPFRPESRPSFAVNLTKNVWFDFGYNVGGSIIDLALRFFRGDRVKANEDLSRFAEENGYRQFEPVESRAPEREGCRIRGGISIINVRDISHVPLAQLITSRGIDIGVARRYCKEVWFENKNKRRCFAIGLPNVALGWELRGLQSFKCSTNPKAISLANTNKPHNRVSVFEGLFDMLSYAAFCKLFKNAEPSCDLLCLNSLSLVKSAYELLCGYDQIDLYLDNDDPGIKASEELLRQYSNAKDKSTLYRHTGHKDLNHWYVNYLMSIHDKRPNSRETYDL